MRKLFSTVAAFVLVGALYFTVQTLVPESGSIAYAQPPKGKGGGKGGFKGKGGGAAYKNLQVINGNVLPQTMQSFVQALGLLDKGACSFCHADDRSSDEKRPKVVARRMITMVRAINGTFPDGQQHVTCYTCHRGDTEPPMEP